MILEAILFFIIFSIVISYLTYIIVSSKNEDEDIQSTNVKQLPCNSGQCIVNLYTGKKVCPSDNSIVYETPGVTYCQDINQCSGPFPFAINIDGSTNLTGECEVKGCPCSKKSRCPEYVMSAFNLNSTELPNRRNKNRKLFSQISNEDNSPISLEFPNNQFCTSTPQWITYTTPGCGFLFEKDFDLNTFQRCLNSNPCEKGILAFISETFEDFNFSNFMFTNVGCVKGTKCDELTIPVFDQTLGKIVCLN